MLTAAMGTLLGVCGDSVMFRGLPITALIDRTQQWNAPLPVTFIEVLQSAVASRPVPGEQFTATIGEVEVNFTVFYVKGINGRWRCECQVMGDANGETIVIGGTPYTGHAFSSVNGTDLELGGLTRQDLIRVALDRFEVDNATMPTEGQAVTFRGITTYRVARVQRDQPGAPVIVDIADEAGGRR